MGHYTADTQRRNLEEDEIVRRVDMREQLIATLRQQARKSNEKKQINQEILKISARKKTNPDYLFVSVFDGEPQEVLIKNRSEKLANELLQLRKRYAHLLTEE
jgi:hypothetical protein